MAKKSSVLFPLIILIVIAGAIIFFGFVLHLPLLIILGFALLIAGCLLLFSTKEVPDGVRL